MKYSKGIMWLDDCRIPFVDEKDKKKNTEDLTRFTDYRNKRLNLGYGYKGGESYETNNQGRFTPNLLVCDDMLNHGDKRSNSRYYDLDLWFDKMLERL